MSDISKTLLAIFGGIIGLAIISVIISKRSRAPEAIGAISNGLAKVVAAAVSPGATATNGDLGASTFSTPNIPNLPTLLGK
jgi:hypothetical protein